MPKLRTLLTVSGLFFTMMLFQEGGLANPGSAVAGTSPVTTDFVLLIDARKNMAGTTKESAPAFGRLKVAVAAANTAVQIIPENTNVAILVLQDGVRTLRPLSPLRADERQSIQAALLALTPRGDAPMRDAVLHLPKALPDPRSKAQTYLLLASDGHDRTFDQTLQATNALKPWTNSLRCVVLATYAAEASRSSLHQLARAIHPEDNAHHVVVHDDISAGLLELRIACDAIESSREQLLTDTRTALRDSQQLVTRLQNQLATLKQVETQRDQLADKLDEMTRAEATQRAAANRLSSKVSTLEAQKAQAEKAETDLSNARQTDRLRAVELEAELKAAHSALTTTRNELQEVTHERETLRQQVKDDVDAKRGLESELKAATVRNELLNRFLRDEEKPAADSRGISRLQGSLTNVESSQTELIEKSSQQMQKLDELLSTITKVLDSPLDYFSQHIGQLLTLLGLGGGSGGIGIYIIAKLLGVDPGTLKKDAEKMETARRDRVESLQAEVSNLRHSLAVPPELTSELQRISTSVEQLREQPALGAAAGDQVREELKARFDGLEKLMARTRPVSPSPSTADVVIPPPARNNLSLIQGLGDKTAAKLAAASIDSLQKLAESDRDTLGRIAGEFPKIFEWQHDAIQILEIADSRNTDLKAAAEELKNA